MEHIAALIAIGISLILIGFFAGVEIAFVSANKLTIELKRKQKTYSGQVWGNFADKPATFIGAMVVCVNIVLVIYGLLVGVLLQPLWDFVIAFLRKNGFPKSGEPYVQYIQLIFEIIVSTFFVLLIEVLFKAIFRAKTNNVLQNGVIAYLVKFFYGAFGWLSALFVSTSNWILKNLLNVRLNEKKEVFNKTDLEQFIHQSKNHEEEDADEINKELFENALSLSETKIRECLIPRKEIESVSINNSIELIKQKFIDSKLSKLVVYENDIDNIIGYIHQLDLFKKPNSLKEILLPIPTVPESMSATDLMNKFSKERKSIAWVIDEFGGTAGIVTMEDLLEEIFGDINDEYDTEEFVEKQLAVGEFIFSGRLELDYITEKYKIPFLEENSSETLSGYIIQNNESIPKQRDNIVIGNYQFEILNVSDTRIETVKIKLLR